MEKTRIRFTFIIFCFLFTIVGIKAFYVQVVNRNKLLTYSEGQWLRKRVIYPKRGRILDRYHDPLAINIPTYSIFTIPREMKGGLENYRLLSKILPQLGLREIKSKIRNRDGYTWLTRKIQMTPKQVLDIKQLPGIYVESVPSRFYPNHELLAQTLGFVGVDNVGLSGVEFKFNQELKGKAKLVKYLQDAKGRSIKFEYKDDTDKSEDIVLSIDKDLQAVVEKLLKQGVEEHRALKGGIGVMDVQTGEILAMANYPSFDPNKLQKEDYEKRKLSFISDPFEPGSVFKVLTIASALENNIVSPETNYFCEYGRMKVENHMISEAETTERFEWLTVTDIIKFSSNIGVTKIAFDLTFPLLKQTLKKFSIGEKTGLEIPGESRGIFTMEDNITPLKLSNLSFGQGVATTGIQMLAAYASIAHKGIYVTPTILKRKKGEIIRQKRILSESVATQLTEMLIKAVGEGTGTNAVIPYFKIAGKTSTAQKAGKDGGYNKYISGFIGFPVNVKNRFVIYVYIDEPQDEPYYGNLVAAPIFKKVAQYILFKERNFRPEELAGQWHEKDLSSENLKLKQSASRAMGPDKVPSFIGLDKVTSIILAEKLQMRTRQKGIGIVRSQFPLPGTKLTSNMLVELNYSPPKYE